jgi:tRNA(Ile2) C34 agmatinyltransferase TiaS
MIPIILGIIFVIALIWIVIHTNPKTVLRYNTKCQKCGKSKGIFKCQMCRV